MTNERRELKQYYNDDYYLELWLETSHHDGYGKQQVFYRLSDSKGVIFEGNDFYPGASMLPTGPRAAADLLILMFSGDMENDWLQKHSPRQIELIQEEENVNTFSIWAEELEALA